MIANLATAAQAIQAGNFPDACVLYILVLSPGTLYFQRQLQPLQQGIGNPLTPIDGLPLTAADGKFQLFWQGPLWLITDTAGMNVLIIQGTGTNQ